MPQRVRLGLSAAAGRRLGERRLRRLLAIELGKNLEVERDTTGPLGDDLVQVWIDLPSREQALIQVRRMGRTLAHRTLDIASYPGDVAARVLALDASEMIRVQAKAPPPSPCAGSVRPGAIAEGRALDAFSATATGFFRWLPASDTALVGGPRIELEHHQGPIAQLLYLQWLAKPSAEAPARSIEAGLGLDARIGLGRASVDWRLRLGTRAGFAAVSERGASPRSAATANLAGRVAIEAEPARSLWLGLAAEPGAVIRPGDERVADFSLGAAFFISAELRR
jgi:hypothetical protein